MQNLLRVCMIVSMKQKPLVLHTTVDKYVE